MGDSTVHGFDSTEATVAIFTAKSEEYRAFCLELEGFGEWNVEKEDEYSEEGLVGEIFFLSHKRNEGAKMNVFVWKLDDEQGSIPAAASITNVMNTFKPRFFFHGRLLWYKRDSPSWRCVCVRWYQSYSGTLRISYEK
mmetsp:Transcript_39669/g.101869  ORF Transcript_39669/g.101869 Transcript_39669/m.101869 type:complete len:138 (+) Transcript_39669:752-1165(+)